MDKSITIKISIPDEITEITKSKNGIDDIVEVEDLSIKEVNAILDALNNNLFNKLYDLGYHVSNGYINLKRG